MTSDRKLILASGSPRRKELLAVVGYEFTVEASGVDETLPEGISTEDIPVYLSSIKAQDVFDRHPGEDAIVIGSDTVVVLDGKIFGKPKSPEDARQMLRELSGRTHEVFTGVTV